MVYLPSGSSGHSRVPPRCLIAVHITQDQKLILRLFRRDVLGVLSESIVRLIQSICRFGKLVVQVDILINHCR